VLQLDVEYLRHPDPPVLEIAAGWDLEFHRAPFREVGYVGFLAHDNRKYDGAELDYVGDICQQTEIHQGIAGCSRCFNVLEHVYAPWHAVDIRVTKVGDLLIGSVPLRTAIHRHDRDFWRFCPDGIAFLLRNWRIIHFAIDGNVGVPANLLFAAVKEDGDWWEHNQDAVLRPEVILGNDYTTVSRLKQRLLQMMRRHLGLSIEILGWAVERSTDAESRLQIVDDKLPSALTPWSRCRPARPSESAR